MKRTMIGMALVALLMTAAGCSLTPVESYWSPRDTALEPGQLEVLFTRPMTGEPGEVVEAGGLTMYDEPVRLYINGDLIGIPAGSTEVWLRPGDYTVSAVPYDDEAMGKAEEIVILPAGRQVLRFVFVE
jgi:hypothetical protein